MALLEAPVASGGTGWCGEHQGGLINLFLGFALVKVAQRWGGGGGGAWPE